MSAAGWLMDQCKVAHRPETLVEGLVEQLEREGLVLLRLSAWLPTQHPELWGSQLMWRRGTACTVIRRPHDIYDTPTFQGTPGQALVAAGSRFDAGSMYRATSCAFRCSTRSSSTRAAASSTRRTPTSRARSRR